MAFDRTPTVVLKIKSALRCLAISDALGGPAEFRRRGSFKLITTFLPNRTFNLAPGTWTDDTSMTLCLAESLSLSKGYNAVDMMKRFSDWQMEGYMSATDTCFDIGITCSRALEIWRKHCTNSMDEMLHTVAAAEIVGTLSGDRSCGNGSLMRVLPVGLAFWRDSVHAVELAKETSRLTHPHVMCQEACAVYTQLICFILQNAATSTPVSKKDIIHQIASFPFTNALLTATFSYNEGDEEYPLLSKQANDIKSSGYVLHTLEAALWAFLTTETFEEGAILTVNLGDDADTVAAVYGGLAGCWYANEGFWEVGKVKVWYEGLVKRDVVEGVADRLASI